MTKSITQKQKKFKDCNYEEDTLVACIHGEKSIRIDCREDYDNIKEENKETTIFLSKKDAIALAIHLIEIASELPN